MGPTQAFEDAQARYVDACAPIISQAYRAGDYSDMWRALSRFTRYDMRVAGNIANAIISRFISLAGRNDRRIDAAAFDCEAFTRAVHSDTSSTQVPETPAGVWLLLAHALDWGPFHTGSYTLALEALIDEAAGRMETR